MGPTQPASQTSIREPHPPVLAEWTIRGRQVLWFDQEVPIDPFAPTEAGPPQHPGELDIGRAVSEGLAAVVRNVFPIFGAGVIGIIAYVVSVCTCVGWIVVLPLLMWGGYRFLLGLVDGRADMRALWTGYDVGTAFVRMWGVILVYIGVSLPVVALGIGIALASGAGKPLGIDLGLGSFDPVMASVATMIPSTLYSLLLVRFMFAPFLVVERGALPMAAFGASWAATGPVWGKMIALQLLFVLLNLPAQVLSVGSQIVNQRIQENPALAAENLPTVMAMTFGIYLLLAVGGILGFTIFTSAYRQVMGKPA